MTNYQVFWLLHYRNTYVLFSILFIIALTIPEVLVIFLSDKLFHHELDNKKIVNYYNYRVY